MDLALGSLNLRVGVDLRVGWYLSVVGKPRGGYVQRNTNRSANALIPSQPPKGDFSEIENFLPYWELQRARNNFSESVGRFYWDKDHSFKNVTYRG